MKLPFATIVGISLVIIPVCGNAEERGTPFSGAYMGLNVGGAWGSADYATDPGCVRTGLIGVFCEVDDVDTLANGVAVARSGSGELSDEEFTGGVQGGYNRQRGRIVFGGEADINAADLGKAITVSGSFPDPFLGDSYTLTESMSTDWLATIRARIGVTLRPQLLIYATGGVAFTEFEFTSSYSDNAINSTFPGGTGFRRRSDLRTGWTIGGGGEWMLGGGWSIKAEYLHIDFGSMNVAVPTSNTPAFTQTIRVDADLDARIARIGVNYRH